MRCTESDLKRASFFQKKRFCVFSEQQRLQEHGSSTSHRDMVEECESLPVKNKVLQVSFQEDNRTTSTSCHTELPPPKESDRGPKQNTAIVQSLSDENRPLEWVKRSSIHSENADLLRSWNFLQKNEADNSLGLVRVWGGCEWGTYQQSSLDKLRQSKLCELLH